MIINIAGGNGPLGRTHKPIFEAAGHSVMISGRKSNPSLEVAATMADLTIVTVPLEVTAEVITRVGPYTTALMDFSGVKVHPVNTMLKYSRSCCEVGGLHPLYGERASIKGESVIYCPTIRSGKKCLEIVGILERAGAKIVKMTPEAHDRYMDLTQNKRTIMLIEYITEMKAAGLNIQRVYSISPAPTKIILDLLARQVDEANGSMYEEMIRHNLFTQRQDLAGLMTPEQIRKYFGSELKPAQERAKRYLETSKERTG